MVDLASKKQTVTDVSVHLTTMEKTVSYPPVSKKLEQAYFYSLNTLTRKKIIAAQVIIRAFAWQQISSSSAKKERNPLKSSPIFIILKHRNFYRTIIYFLAYILFAFLYYCYFDIFNVHGYIRGIYLFRPHAIPTLDIRRNQTITILFKGIH